MEILLLIWRKILSSSKIQAKNWTVLLLGDYKIEGEKEKWEN